MNTTKEDLAREISETHEISKAKAKRIVDQIFDKISDNLESGKKTMISGFGTFETKERKERKGFNLVKKEIDTIAGTKIAKFIPSPILEKKIKKVE